MKISADLEKKYNVFNKTLENLKTVRSIEEPYTVISRTGIVGLFNVCCDSAYIFVKNFLMFQGYFLPVTAFPNMIIKTAHQCGIIDDEELWADIVETRNVLSGIHDEDETMKAIEKIRSEYISVFEKLKQDVAEKLAEQDQQLKLIR